MNRIGLWGIDRHNYYTKVVASYLKAFGDLGVPGRLVAVEDLQNFVRSPGPDGPAAVLDVNFCGASAPLLGRLGIAYVSAVWDVWIQSPRTPPRFEHYRPEGLDYAFSFSEDLVEPLRAKGVRHVEYLPACCDLETFRPLPPDPAEDARCGSPVSFYATPLVADQPKGYAMLVEHLRAEAGRAQGAARDVVERARAALEEAFREQEADLFRYRFPEILAAQERRNLTRLFSVEWTPFKETAVNELSLRISMLQRTEAARLLAPFGVAVWGPEDWRQVPGVDYRGYADFHRDLPRIASASQIHLNVPKCHTLGAVPPRVFEILACGGFLLTSPIRPLERHFADGEDLVVFRSREELVEKARFFLEHGDERRRIAERGMRKARALHGFRPRAERILEVLRAEGRL